MPVGSTRNGVVQRERQQAFIDAKRRGMNDYDAVVAAGYSRANAPSTIRRLLNNPQVIEALGVSLDKMGITDQAIFEPIALGLKAMRYQDVITGRGKQRRRKTIEVPDIPLRMRAAAIAWRMKQEYTGNPFKPGTSDLPPDVADKLSQLDELEVSHAVFRKSKNTSNTIDSAEKQVIDDLNTSDS